jgi:solute carrier family 50 protein (sugar transporter)
LILYFIYCGNKGEKSADAQKDEKSVEMKDDEKKQNVVNGKQDLQV